MGNAQQQQQQGGGGSGGGGSGGGGGLFDLTPVINWLGTIWGLLAGVFGRGQSIATSDVFATVGTSPILLYAQSTPVKKAVIQNLASTDNITVYAVPGKQSKAAQFTKGNGIILNKAPASAQGGGSLTLGNVDLNSFSFVTDTNAAQSIVVYYEQ